MTLKIEKTETVYQGWSTVSKLSLSDGDVRFTREVEDHGQAAGVLPFDPQRRVALLVQMPRLPVILAGGSEHLLELPAGLIDPGEEPEAAARREAFEEAGVRLTELERIGYTWTCPGVSTERIILFLAAYSQADRTGAGGGLETEHENIVVVEHRLADLAAAADAGRLEDMKTFLMVQSLRLRRPELFG